MEKKVNDYFNEMCDAIREYKRAVAEELRKVGKELPLDNGYGEDEPLVIYTFDDDMQTIVYELDKARYDKKHECVEFHAVSIDYDDADEWIPYYYLNSDDTYAMENIKWED